LDVIGSKGRFFHKIGHIWTSVLGQGFAMRKSGVARSCSISFFGRAALVTLASSLASACVIDTREEHGASSGPATSAAAGGGSGGAAGSAGAGAGGLSSAAGSSSGGQAGAIAGSGGQAGAATAGAGGQAGTAGTAGALGGAGSGGVAHVPRLGGALKILPFGDSITASTCYRARLAEELDAAHAADYDFVGSQSGDKGCGYTYDSAHEGHGGYLITQHTGELAGWAAANPADVVLLHFATNDVWNNVSAETILGAYSQALDEFRKNNANVTVLVAQIIPLEPDGCGHCDVAALNAAIPGWASGKSTEASPILVVDQWTGYSAATDSEDKVHPNDAGSSKMAANWAAALEPLF
jgi:hypothetical protein